MLPCYDLATQPASYDIFQWLVTVKTRGETAVRLAFNGKFKSKHYTDQPIRFENIIKPGIALSGLEYTIGDKEGVEHYHGIGGVIKAYKEFGRIEKLKGVLPPKPGGITVTLRNMDSRQQRNSGPDWLRFAKEVGALVIPDFKDKGIDLHERMALYEGARMNFFVGNGPATLCIHSEAPYAVLKVAPEAEGSGSVKFLRSEGLEPGAQYPWANARQKLFWGGDTYDEIMRAYEEMK